MTLNNAQNRNAYTQSMESRRGFSRQDIIELTRQAIAKAQPLALNSDKVIILNKFPANAMVFADPEKILHGMGMLLTSTIATSPNKSAISINIMFRGMQVMIALEDQGEGLDKHTVDQVLADFDHVTWPDIPDPTDATIPSNTRGADHTALHIRKLASSEQNATQDQITISAVLAFPRITFRQMT